MSESEKKVVYQKSLHDGMAIPGGERYLSRPHCEACKPCLVNMYKVELSKMFVISTKPDRHLAVSPCSGSMEEILGGNMKFAGIIDHTLDTSCFP